MKNNILISFIITVYNSEKYLEKCIQSVIRNTNENVEVILVDDGSIDKSNFICDNYAEKYTRIKTIHISNNGVSHARNIGIDMAQGKYITFVDSDDEINENYLKILEFIAINKFQMFVFDYTLKNINAERLTHKSEESCHFDENSIKQLIMNCEDDNNVWSHIYDADIIKRNNIRFNENVKFGEDLIFNLDYVDKIKNAYYLSLNCYIYNSDNNNSAVHRYNGSYISDIISIFVKYNTLYKSNNGLKWNFADRYFLNFIYNCLRKDEKNVDKKIFFDSDLYYYLIRFKKPYGKKDCIKVAYVKIKKIIYRMCDVSE